MTPEYKERRAQRSAERKAAKRVQQHKASVREHLREHDAKHPAGSVRVEDEIAQSALKRIAASDAADAVVVGEHNWALNFELSANAAGFSVLLPLSDFKAIIPVAQNVEWDVPRGMKISDTLAAASTNSLLFAIIAVLDALGVHKPEVDRNADHPEIIQFTGKEHMLGLILSEDQIVFL